MLDSKYTIHFDNINQILQNEQLKNKNTIKNIFILIFFHQNHQS
jgi:hypothetical protein